jgi:hypothetical protein
MRQLVLREGIRADGRAVTDIRPITSRAGVLPRTHGSSLFTRGETQVGFEAWFWRFEVGGSCMLAVHTLQLALHTRVEHI